MGLKILAIASAIPKPDTSAGDLRFFKLLQILAQQNEVDLCVAADERDGRTKEFLSKLDRYCQDLEAIGVRILPFKWKHIEIALLRSNYDVGLFEFYFVVKDIERKFRRYLPQSKVIVDTVDIFFMLEKSGAFGEIDPAQIEKTRREELSAYRSADALITVIESDMKTLLEQGDMPPLFIIPIIMPVRRQNLGERNLEVVFIGGFHHLPNRDGVLWFVEKVWPTVHQAVPGASFTVIGSDVPVEISALNSVPGVEIVGYVPDTSAIFDRAAVSVAPLRHGGAGMKGKVVEALASGVAVVSTSIGAQGLNAVSGEHLIVVDQADGFAGAVIELLENPDRCQQLGRAGQQLINSLCSPQSAEKTFQRIQNEVIDKPCPSSFQKHTKLETFRLLILLHALEITSTLVNTLRIYVKPVIRYLRRTLRRSKFKSTV